jgi:hypothetical protein
VEGDVYIGGLSGTTGSSAAAGTSFRRTGEPRPLLFSLDIVGDCEGDQITVGKRRLAE